MISFLVIPGWRGLRGLYLRAAPTRSKQTGSLGLGFLERHVYLVALFGLAVFYGLERAARSSRRRNRRQGAAGYAALLLLSL